MVAFHLARQQRPVVLRRPVKLFATYLRKAIRDVGESCRSLRFVSLGQAPYLALDPHEIVDT
jgi:hypothetical protein